jgi:hypothetical protein
MIHEAVYTSVHSTDFKYSMLSSQSRIKAPEDHKTRTIACIGCGHQKTITMNCGLRTCQYCREIVIRRALARKGILNKRLTGLRFMTLTVKSVQSFTQEEVQKIREYFRKLIRRKDWLKCVQGGLYVIEVTQTSKGYHIHLHILYSGKYLPWSMLQKHWKQITGGSYIIWISKVHDSKNAVNYVLGYISKSEKSNVNKEDFLRVMHGIKLVNFFGTWVKMKAEKKPCICPKCQATEWVIDYQLNPKFFTEECNERAWKEAKIIELTDESDFYEEVPFGA